MDQVPGIVAHTKDRTSHMASYMLPRNRHLVSMMSYQIRFEARSLEGLVAAILAISRVSINPTPSQGRVPQCLPVIVYLCSTPALLPSRRCAVPELQWCVLQCCNNTAHSTQKHRFKPKVFPQICILSFRQWHILKSDINY